jgi:hypothetical protein
MPAPAPIPPAKARTAINPLVAVVGVIAIVAVVAGAVYATSNHGPSASTNPGRSGAPTPTAASAAPASAAATPTKATQLGSGSVTVTPATFGCNDPGDAKLDVVLPSSVTSDMSVTVEIDSASLGDMAVDTYFEQQADGSWAYSDTQSMTSLCQQAGSGKHVLHVLDEAGTPLAQGSFTITETAPTPTPATVSGGAIIVVPALFSCSGSTSQVSLTIVLGASVAADEEVALMIDDQLVGSDTVGTGFEKQSDGTWLSSDNVTLQSLCAYGNGAHTIKVLDSTKKILAQGTFTTEA